MQLLNVVDILIIAENIATDMLMPNSSIFALKRNEGLPQIAKMLETGRIDIKPYKFLVLLCGKTDLKEPDMVFKEGLHKVLKLIDEQNPLAITVLTAAIPTPGDSTIVIRTSGYQSGYMARLAEELDRIEFSKPGKRLLKPGGVILEYFDQFGNLNVRGLEQISKGLVAKFTCAKLRQKYQDLLPGDRAAMRR